MQIPSVSCDTSFGKHQTNQDEDLFRKFCWLVCDIKKYFFPNSNMKKRDLESKIRL